MPRSRVFRLGATAVTAAVAAALAGCSPAPDRQAAGPPELEMGQRPNIVFVLADDLSRNLVKYMPQVGKLKDDGVDFKNYFVTNSLCCPSRATTFTGKLPHNTGVFSNGGRDGGFNAFHRRHEARATFATSLQNAGYRTALFGKYLNKYPVRKKLGQQHAYVPPGWSQWAVTTSGYQEYNYWMNVDGHPQWHGRGPRDYMTNQLTRRGLKFINDSVRMNRPFMLELAPFAPHLPATPAPQDTTKYNDLKAPRNPSFNEPDISDKPYWLKHHRKLTPKWKRELNQQFRNRVRSVQAVDRMIAQVRALLKARGLSRNTYVVFASDNGLHLGEHRLRQGKLTTFDIDIHVPLVVAGPHIKKGRTERALTANTDLCPTFVKLGRGKPLPKMDGQSLVPLLTGKGTWHKRPAVLIEHHGPDLDKSDPDVPHIGSGNPPSYEAIRTLDEEYGQYIDGEHEYYDVHKDPYELDNTYKKLGKAKRQRLAATVRRLSTCSGPACYR